MGKLTVKGWGIYNSDGSLYLDVSGHPVLMAVKNKTEAHKLVGKNVAVEIKATYEWPDKEGG